MTDNSEDGKPKASKETSVKRDERGSFALPSAETPIATAAKALVGSYVAHKQADLVRAQNALGAAIEENIAIKSRIIQAQAELDTSDELAEIERIAIRSELRTLKKAERDAEDEEKTRETRGEIRDEDLQEQLLERKRLRRLAEKKLADVENPPVPEPVIDPLDRALADLDRIHERADALIKKIKEDAGGDDKLDDHQRVRIERINEWRHVTEANLKDKSYR